MFPINYPVILLMFIYTSLGDEEKLDRVFLIDPKPQNSFLNEMYFRLFKRKAKHMLAVP